MSRLRRTISLEGQDDFYDEIEKGNKKIRKNYIIKSYVLGDYLNTNVSLEREAFNFPKDKSDKLFSYSQKDIEKQVAEITKEAFEDEGIRIPYEINPRREGDIEKIYGDITKAEKIMGWVPQRSVKDSVRSIIKKIENI